MTDAYEWKEPCPARDKNRIPRSSHGHFVVQMVINDSDEVRQIGRDGRERGIIDELYLVTEYARDPVKLFNAELMRGCRDADQEADDEARIVVGEMAADASISSLVKLIGLGPRGLRALVRLIRSTELELLANEKICPDTLVRRVGGYLYG